MSILQPLGNLPFTHFLCACKYDDLYRLLYNLALSVGAIISFGATITSVSVDEETECPCVTLSDGCVLEADVVIGADGYKSLVRAYVNGQEDEGVETGQSFLTFVV